VEFENALGLLDDFDLVGAYSPGFGRHLKRVQYTRDRLWLLGLGHAKFGLVDGNTVYVNTYRAKVAAVFRPRRLVLQAATPSEAYPTYMQNDPLSLFVVEEITVNAKSQFAGAARGILQAGGGFSGDGYPAAGFRAEANDSLVKFDTCYPGNEITVTIRGDDSDIIAHEITWDIVVGMFGYSAGRE
jgi:hypothetical protein